MPNCDWGRPCDCLDCRTSTIRVLCPHCGFNNALSVIGYSTFSIDRKGVGGYDFTVPTGTKDLDCYCCSKVIPDVSYYDSYNEAICENNLKIHNNKLNGLVCDSCGAAEGENKGQGIHEVNLNKLDNELYCQTCIIDVGSKKIPDPSNENEKYIFQGETVKWILHKVKITCPTCRKKRWLKAENKWKKECKKCYLTS
ncbi:hypothetical protein ACQKND_16385 [Viridibacillus arvi]|uniref:hypothetical protein n=1 Tax=Viridibacillus arvi TaxID=263475 RepID=UPI003CFC9D73